MHEIHLRYTWYVPDIHMRCSWYIPELYPRYTWYSTPEIGLWYAKDMPYTLCISMYYYVPWICLEYAFEIAKILDEIYLKNSWGINVIYTWVIGEIYLRCTQDWDTPKIYPRCLGDFNDISKRYTQEIPKE